MTRGGRTFIFRNRHIVKYASEAVLFCGRQCIALRGDNEVLNCENPGNPGNLLAALQRIANHDDILKEHLCNMGLSSQKIIHQYITFIPEKVCIRAKWPIRPALISGFRSMKRLGILLLPPGWDASPSQGYPPAL